MAIQLNNPGTLLHGFSVGGNGLPGDLKVVTKAMDLECRRVLENDNFNTFTRLTLPAAQQIDAAGVGSVIYRLANRVVWGSDYNEMTGSERQMGSQKSMNVYLNQLLTLDFTFPRNDMERLRGAVNEGRTVDAATIAQDLAAHWVASYVKNQLMALELIHLQGIRDYYIWRYQYDKNSVLVIDPTKAKDNQGATDLFYSIGEKMVDKITSVTQNEVGTNRTDWRIFFGSYFWLDLSRVYMNIIAGTTPVAAETLATGALYRDQILGTDIQEHIYLQKWYPAGTIAAMNKDVSFDLRGVYGFAQHKENEAFPMSFNFLETFLDNDTRNLRTIGRIVFGLPAFTRGNLGFLIMDHEPTAQEIANATAKIMPKDDGSGDYNTNLNYTFQLTQPDLILANGKNDDGSTNLKLNLAKGQNFYITQAMFQLELSQGDWVFVCTTNPNKAPGSEVANADYTKWDTKKWEDLKENDKLFMVCGHWKDPNKPQDAFIVDKTVQVTIINSTSTIG